jgi:hypothetical protein
MARAKRHFIPGYVWHGVKSWEPMAQFSLTGPEGDEEAVKLRRKKVF